jgi:hypothetical protein
MAKLFCQYLTSVDICTKYDYVGQNNYQNKYYGATLQVCFRCFICDS